MTFWAWLRAKSAFISILMVVLESSLVNACQFLKELFSVPQGSGIRPVILFCLALVATRRDGKYHYLFVSSFPYLVCMYKIKSHHLKWKYKIDCGFPIDSYEVEVMNKLNHKQYNLFPSKYIVSLWCAVWFFPSYLHLVLEIGKL